MSATLNERDEGTKELKANEKNDDNIQIIVKTSDEEGKDV